MIREGTFDDIPSAAAMRQRAWPDTIITVEGMRHSLANVPERAELVMLAWEEDGEIVGWGTAGREWWVAEPNRGTLAVAVDPSRRGGGIGSALADAADRHLTALGVTTTRAGSVDEPGARALASRLGFAELSASATSAVDPRAVEPTPVPEGVRLVPFAELDDPRPLYELDMEVTPDIPNEDFDGISFEEWRDEFWRSPLVDQKASLAAFVGDELAALTMIRIDEPSGRAQNNLTGTRRAFRGRGLARVLKTHSLHLAGERGATIAITDNDETNEPMLAVNTKLGYRPFSRRIEWERIRDSS
ncbi:MAG TPA: GNAT family N-acetyltransferase [Gaiella sp.]|nr:GNAT family N-acetyltransferase [Gaiella sp.]